MHASERLKGIDVFVCVVEVGSFTAAGERLNLTNSAVGKAIARLESRLGVRLLERTTRRLHMTEPGEAFYRTCIRVLGELEEAEQVLSAQTIEPTGRLRIDLPATFGRMKVMPLILDFAERYPGIQPQITFTDRYVDVIEDAIDIAVRIGDVQSLQSSVGRRHLGSERRIFCCSPKYLEKHGEPYTLAALLKLDIIFYGRTNGDASPLILDSSEGASRLQPEARLIVGNAEAQVDSVVRGFGIAQLSTWLIADELKSGALVEILPTLATEGLPLHLLWPRSRQLLPKVDALISHLGASLSV